VNLQQPNLCDCCLEDIDELDSVPLTDFLDLPLVTSGLRASGVLIREKSGVFGIGSGFRIASGVLGPGITSGFFSDQSLYFLGLSMLGSCFITGSGTFGGFGLSGSAGLTRPGSVLISGTPVFVTAALSRLMLSSDIIALLMVSVKALVKESILFSLVSEYLVGAPVVL